ncbi:hypothetical protein TWF730_004422 [Orbilia blumenaviensis]|uniref:Uncharacterized protein n=1 Tax=Orbilia blumenaviensis TaxID=1796055 RepID=A0AAV9TYE6_9PEZI
MALDRRQDLNTLISPRPTAQPTATESQNQNQNQDPNTNILSITQDQPAPTATSITPPYQFSSDKSLSGVCRLTNSTAENPNGLFSNTFQCTKLIPASSVKQNTGAIAAAVVFALLFAATAVLLFLVWWRGRRIRSAPTPPSSYGTEHTSSYQLKENTNNSNSNEISTLTHQLSLERRRVSDLQAALLSQSSSQPGGWSTSHPKDDRSLKRAFSSIFLEIRDFAGNHFSNSSSSSSSSGGGSVRIPSTQITGELKEILEECITSHTTFLTTSKGRNLLIRITTAELIRRAWTSHEFLGRKPGHALSTLEREVVKGTNREYAHLWRVQTFGRVLAGIGEDSRVTAWNSVADHIWTVLTPFRPKSTGKQYLQGLVRRTAELYYELATQNAYYELTPYFSVTRESAGEDEAAVFEYASCDDVEQKWEVGTDESGREWCAAEGRGVTGFVFPGVVKYGDGRGGGWGEGRVVVFKAQVLV